MLPTFIHIGPGRSGTTMLYEAFKEHPDICTSFIKETKYFFNHYHKGVGWYQSFFERCANAVAIGEVSNNYFYEPEVPARIAGLLPDVKIITVLRNPFDHVHSVYAYKRRDGTITPDISFEEALERYPEFITESCYGDYLNRYLKYFPAKNVLIAFYDDLKQDPGRFIQSIFRFIGVDDSFIPKSIYKQVNPSVFPRYPWLTSRAYLVADSLRQWQLHSLLSWAKRSPVVRSVLFKPREMPIHQVGFSKQVNELLMEHFLPQIREVERITGRTLREWYQTEIEMNCINRNL